MFVVYQTFVIEFVALFLYVTGEENEDQSEPDTNDQWLLKYPTIYENRKYAPRDMLALLKNLDVEIGQFESMLIDEIEKRKKYKVIIFSIIYLKFTDSEIPL